MGGFSCAHIVLVLRHMLLCDLCVNKPSGAYWSSSETRQTIVEKYPAAGGYARVSEMVAFLLTPSMQVCPFSLRVVSVVGITYLLPQEEQPLCHPTVER